MASLATQPNQATTTKSLTSQNKLTRTLTLTLTVTLNPKTKLRLEMWPMPKVMEPTLEPEVVASVYMKNLSMYLNRKVIK